MGDTGPNTRVRIKLGYGLSLSLCGRWAQAWARGQALTVCVGTVP